MRSPFALAREAWETLRGIVWVVSLPSEWAHERVAEAPCFKCTRAIAISPSTLAVLPEMRRPRFICVFCVTSRLKREGEHHPDVQFAPGDYTPGMVALKDQMQAMTGNELAELLHKHAQRRETR